MLRKAGNFKMIDIRVEWRARTRILSMKEVQRCLVLEERVMAHFSRFLVPVPFPSRPHFNHHANKPSFDLAGCPRLEWSCLSLRPYSCLLIEPYSVFTFTLILHPILFQQSRVAFISIWSVWCLMTSYYSPNSDTFKLPSLQLSYVSKSSTHSVRGSRSPASEMNNASAKATAFASQFLRVELAWTARFRSRTIGLAIWSIRPGLRTSRPEWSSLRTIFDSVDTSLSLALGDRFWNL